MLGSLDPEDLLNPESHYDDYTESEESAPYMAGGIEWTIKQEDPSQASPQQENQSDRENMSKREAKQAKQAKIPRPPNSFIIFRSERHNLVRESHPNIPNTEVSKIIGEMWKKLSDSEKQEFEKKAEQAKKEHSEQYPTWKFCPRRRRRRMKKLTGQKYATTPLFSVHNKRPIGPFGKMELPLMQLPHLGLSSGLMPTIPFSDDAMNQGRHATMTPPLNRDWARRQLEQSLQNIPPLDFDSEFYGSMEFPTSYGDWRNGGAQNQSGSPNLANNSGNCSLPPARDYPFYGHWH